MNKIRPTLILSCALLTGALLVFFTACEISNGDETVREVSLQVSGAYQNTAGIPAQQSGQKVTLISISQSGDQLEGVDNLGIRWTGTIGRAEGSLATFVLDGTTSTGIDVVLAGNITVSGTTANLSGTWVEPNLRSAASAQAAVAAQPTASPITPTPSVTTTPAPGTTPTPTIFVTP